MRVAGLAVGFAGVLWLVWNKASLKHGVDDASTVWAIAVCLMATLLYGFSANISKQHLGNVSSICFVNMESNHKVVRLRAFDSTE
jgi:drug/metabolite transporter (DMT)-like permease